ncbi:CDGSH iron-sulfur domain-containing protein [Streptomyces sp. NPDC091879]|uniref:CDGSH iron-sulfur domain-containing protein n=1 Tax=Streptomyces sp. NPDC091879 TaxID=3366006 RepID=UPI00382AD9E0
MMEGPVEVVLADGTVARSERFMVAVCTCRRSRAYPWCDTSHRRRQKPDNSLTSGDQPGNHADQPDASKDRSAPKHPQDRTLP